jgi:hypothetical protein
MMINMATYVHDYMWSCITYMYMRTCITFMYTCTCITYIYMYTYKRIHYVYIYISLWKDESKFYKHKHQVSLKTAILQLYLVGFSRSNHKPAATTNGSHLAHPSPHFFISSWPPIRVARYIVYFQTKTPYLGIYWRTFEWLNVGMFFGHLVIFPQFWYVVPRKIWQPCRQSTGPSKALRPCKYALQFLIKSLFCWLTFRGFPSQVLTW